MAFLRKVYPWTPVTTLQEFLPYLIATMDKYEINTPTRINYFLAQIGHESGGLKWLEEFATGKAYEGRWDLGNIKPGDGVRYKGRGVIQLTGRNNYKKAGSALGIDLIDNPELAATPKWGVEIAGWYWDSRKLNVLSDRQDFKAVTRSINGGYNGLADRMAYLDRAVSNYTLLS